MTPMKKTQRILLLTVVALALVTAGARAQEARLLPVLQAWQNGTAGLAERPLDVRLQKGHELPVVRGGAIIGIFTVTFCGEVNVWGRFASHDAQGQLQPGDMIVLPASTEKPPRKRLTGKTHVLYGVAGPTTVWCFLNRGTADGLRNGTTGTAWLGENNVGEFQVVFTGSGRAYGFLMLSEPTDAALFDRLEVSFN